MRHQPVKNHPDYKRNDSETSKQITNLNEPDNSIAKIDAGSICTVKDGDGKYGVVKVLVIDDEIAHLKVYKNKYDTRPNNIDIKSLSMGTIKDKDGFGIGHVPLAKAGFIDWKPIVVAHEDVKEEEPEGYKIWKDQ